MPSVVATSRRSGTIAGRRTYLAVACLFCAALCFLASGAPAPAASATAITEAPDLEWGVKQSWRSYVGPPDSTTDGAQVIPPTPGGPYQLGWEFDNGSYDATDGTTVLRYKGTVHWLKYPGTQFPGLKPASYSGPMDINILDVRISDPIITISATGSTILAEVDSRSRDTWEMEHFAAARIAELDIGGMSPALSGGTTTWATIHSAAGADAPAVFAGNYRQGTAFDAVSFAYTGPGGAPDVSEHWDQPGSSPLAFDASVTLTDNGLNLGFRPWLLDRDRRIVYFAQGNNPSVSTGSRYQAFSLDSMEPLGQPIETLSGTPENPTNTMFFDTNTGRVFFEASGGGVRWMKYDDGQGWLQGQATGSFPRVGERQMMWDSVGRRAFNFVLNKPAGVGASDYDNQQWQLNTYTEQSDGSWVRNTYNVENGPLGLNRDRYSLASTLTSPTGLAAPDGSLIVLGNRQRSNNPAVPVPSKVIGAYRIVIDETSGTAQVEPIAGTDVDNSLSGMFTEVLSGQGNQVVLARQDFGAPIPTLVQTVSIPGNGSPAVAGPLVTLPGVETGGAVSFAVDREDGTIWIGGNTSQRITGVRDGHVVASQYFPERHPRGGPVMVGLNHTVYAQTNDGSPADFGGSKFYGMGRFTRLGISPDVTLDPASQGVSLGVAEESKTIELLSEANGEPDPARRWQVKAPGSSRFLDIAGETEGTLDVEAERGMDGTEYRAVYENAAGRIASEPATLSVEYAPRMAADVPSISVAEGTDAEFSVIPDGNPEPTVTWQRRVSGFWQTIDPGDDNFLGADGPNLTVLGTNTDQSGSLFRAKLVNSVGTAFSNSAKLTVTPRLSIPSGGLDLDNVSLEWTGNEEMQKAPPAGGSNYFSAGVSGGSEATYKSVEGNAAVYQRSSAGSESLATWSTRAAHVLGGGEQLVRLYGGDARIESDGSATVQWDGSFSVNFYGGLVPWTIIDPKLTIDASGTGTLKAEMAGCASNIDSPGTCTLFSPISNVTVADFSGVQIDPSGEVTFTPKYAGVQVDDVDPTKPQVRTGTGWGSWPASFVSFHVQTGLAAYWYTSGSAFDPDKAPSPFVVDFQGDPAPSAPPPEEKATQTPSGSTVPSQESTPTNEKAASISATKRTQRLGGRRVARLATLSCPGSGACKVSAPRRVRAKIGKRRYPFVVIAPKRIGAGRKAMLRLRLTKPALKALGKHKSATTVKLRVHTGGRTYEIRVMLRGAGNRRARIVHIGVREVKGGSNSPHDVESGSISAEPPLLQRPPTAVDVSNVRLTWYPRDSWLRYASSGVAARDGIHIDSGATGTNSTSSACPDRPSTSDAQLPYTIDFTPKASWYDPASGIAGIYGQGSVNFRWKAHTIDLIASEPEIEIAGASSRAIFRFSGTEGTPYPNQRADLLSLDTAGKPTVTDGGKTLTYDLMRGKLTPNGENVFAGFYTAPANNEFGCISVSFTTP